MTRLDRRPGTGLYRSRKGVILGVIRGMAEYFDFSVFWARIIAVILLLVTGFWPVTALYFVAALLMKPRPVMPIEDEDEQDFYDTYVGARRSALRRLKRRYESLDRRLQRMEHTVTLKDYDWESRLNS